MRLSTLDWIVVAGYGPFTLVIGLYFARRAGARTDDYFLGGRSMPWWLLLPAAAGCVGAERSVHRRGGVGISYGPH